MHLQIASLLTISKVYCLVSMCTCLLCSKQCYCASITCRQSSHADRVCSDLSWSPMGRCFVLSSARLPSRVFNLQCCRASWKRFKVQNVALWILIKTMVFIQWIREYNLPPLGYFHLHKNPNIGRKGVQCISMQADALKNTRSEKSNLWLMICFLWIIWPVLFNFPLEIDTVWKSYTCQTFFFQRNKLFNLDFLVTFSIQTVAMMIFKRMKNEKPGDIYSIYK